MVGFVSQNGSVRYSTDNHHLIQGNSQFSISLHYFPVFAPPRIHVCNSSPARCYATSLLESCDSNLLLIDAG